MPSNIMKKIILVRHAKSSWEFNITDHERPLKERGLKDAELVSKHLVTYNLSPDLVLSSDANRAKATATIFIKNLNIDKNKMKLDHNLYDFTGRKLLQAIKNCDNSVGNLMVFGHNHALTGFVNSYGDTFIDNVPTCGVVILEFNIESWEDLIKGKTLKTLFPKILKKK